jgi:hypothetical protein
MAVTAAYLAICTIPGDGGTVSESKTFANIAATTASFLLKGGKYGVSCVGSTFGTATLQVLGPDGTTWLTALTAFAANGYATVDLPIGSYRFALA